MDKSPAALELLKAELQTHRRTIALLCGRGTHDQAAADAPIALRVTSGDGGDAGTSACVGSTGSRRDQCAAGQPSVKEVAAALGDVAAAAYLAVASTTCCELSGDVETDIKPSDQGPVAARRQRPRTASKGVRRHSLAASGSPQAAAAAAQPEQAPSGRAPSVGRAQAYGSGTHRAGAFVRSMLAASGSAVTEELRTNGASNVKPATAAASSRSGAAMFAAKPSGQPAPQRPEWVGIRNIPKSCSVSSCEQGAGASSGVSRTAVATTAMRSCSAPRTCSRTKDRAAEKPCNGRGAAPGVNVKVSAATAALPHANPGAPGAAAGLVQPPVTNAPDSAADEIAPQVFRSSTAGDASFSARAAGPAFPALERTMLRRQRLASLLSRGRVATEECADNSAALAGPSSVARCALDGAAADAVAEITTPVVGSCAGSAVVSHGLWSAMSGGGDTSAGHNSLRVPAGAGGSQGSAASSNNTSGVAAATAISRSSAQLGSAAARATTPQLGSAADAYAALRVWRAKRVWAAAVICTAARRYLDRRTNAQARRAMVAAAHLTTGKLSRILARWRAAATARGLLRRRYAGLALLSAEARPYAAEALLAGLAGSELEEPAAGTAHARHAEQEGLGLHALSPALAEALAWLCYSPAATSAVGGGSYEPPSTCDYGLVRGDRGWGSAVATSHRRFCREGIAAGGVFGQALAHRRWWLLRAAWCGFVLEAVAPLPQ